jgi:hypothetical protein
MGTNFIKETFSVKLFYLILKVLWIPSSYKTDRGLLWNVWIIEELEFL